MVSAPTHICFCVSLPVQIRGEFMRASRVLAARPERAIVALAQLCEERKDEDPVRVAAATSPFVPPRLSPVPPQTPYTVSSSPIRSSGEILADRSIPQAPRPANEPSAVRQTRLNSPPEHMAPKRGKWTSPPPPEAPTADHSAFEDQLGRGLALATSSRYGRESVHTSSSNNTEILTDDERSDLVEADDCCSVHSFVEGSTGTSSSSGSPANSSPRFASEADRATPGVSDQRRAPVLSDQHPLPLINLPAPKPAVVAPSRIDSVRRPMTSAKQSFSSALPFGYAASHPQHLSGLRYSPSSPTVFYETAGRIPSFRFAAAYPGPSISTISSQYDQPPLYHVISASFSPTASLPQHVLMARKRNSRKSDPTWSPARDETGSDTPTSSTASYHSPQSPSSPPHSHSPSTVTIKAGPPPPTSTSHFSVSVRNNQSSPISSDPSSSSRTRSPKRFSYASQLQSHSPCQTVVQEDSSMSMYDCTPDLTFSSSPPASISAGSSESPDSSSTSSNYATTPSSTSPPSPTRLNYITTQREGASPLMLAALQQASKHTGVDLPPSTIGNRLGGGVGAVVVARQEFGLR
jgi:terminal uridylyltransferase